MSDDYVALLKNARDIPILNTGIDNSVTSECTFPTKEHPSLVTHTGKTVNTGYPGGVLRMQYHSTAAVPDFFFFAPSEWMNVIG